MQVRDLMQTRVFAVAPDDMIDRVFFLLHYEKIRHLPVVEGGQVVGIVSDRDLYKALGPKSRSASLAKGKDDTTLYVIPRKVRHIMKRGVITIEPGAPVGRAAALMSEKKIGALPVVEGGQLVGILTATDLLAALAKIVNEETTR